jgi:hypothetical protein
MSSAHIGQVLNSGLETFPASTLDSLNTSHIASSEEMGGDVLSCFLEGFAGFGVRVIGSGKQVGHSLSVIEYFFLQYIHIL